MKLGIFATLFLSTTEAFTQTTQGTHTRSGYANYVSATATALHLLPNQGCQLAAASAAALAKESRKVNTQTEHATPMNAARELVSRIFNLPSEILKVPDIDFPFAVNTDVEDDIAIFPIVGFTFVKLEDKMKVIPSVNAKGAINIENLKRTREEEVHGWFSSSCQLGSPHADDDASYSGMPDSLEDFMVREDVKEIHSSEM